eukprot:m.171117 g.171117  ORF g.171117 m.171117 type:complete len:723 (-) comp16701_c0_seq4:136-2304(-)
MSKNISLIVGFHIPSAEKRRDSNNRNKHYVYEVVVQYEDGAVERIWRRYSQFDALRDTLLKLIKSSASLPKLTKKLYLQRSSVHEVAIFRQPKLTLFLQELLPLQSEPRIAATLKFFITQTASDKQRDAMPAAEGMIEFDTEAASPAPEPSTPTSQTAIMARVLYAYQAQDDDELTVDVDDVIEVLAEFDDGWAQASKDESVGLLGINYYEKLAPGEIVPISTPSAQPSSMSPEPIAPTRSLPKPTNPPLPKPTNPLEELHYTEHEYVRMLNEVKDGFFPRLRSHVTAPEAKAFFNNFAELIPAHTSLLTELAECQHNVSNLDASLSQHLTYFKDIYARYCAGLPKAQELYESKLGDRQFRAFEAAMPDLNKPTLNYIMRPFQRVLKYPLLLKELSKSQGRTFPAATVAAEALAMTANENMNAGQEHVSKLDISAPNTDSFQRLVSIPHTDPAPSTSETAAAQPPRPPPPSKSKSSGGSRPPPPSSKPPSKSASKTSSRRASDEVFSTGFVMPQLKPVAKAEPKAAITTSAPRTALQPPGSSRSPPKSEAPAAKHSSTSKDTLPSSSMPTLTKPSTGSKLPAAKPPLPTKPTMLKPVLAKKPPPPVKPNFTLRNARGALKPTTGGSAKPKLPSKPMGDSSKPSLPVKPTSVGQSKAASSPSTSSSRVASLQAKFAQPSSEPSAVVPAKSATMAALQAKFSNSGQSDGNTKRPPPPKKAAPTL